MKEENRYRRFEPITVRAAARVLHLQQVGEITEREARFYVRELATLDAYARGTAPGALWRLVRRRASCTRSLLPRETAGADDAEIPARWETAPAEEQMPDTCERHWRPPLPLGEESGQRPAALQKAGVKHG